MYSSLDKKNKISLLTTMIRIREFENVVSEFKMRGEIIGQVHSCVGQEALVTGTCLALFKSDYVISNHRSHGHIIAKGGDLNLLMAEIFGKATGTNGGRGGSMHLFDSSVGVINTTAIVGSGLPLACGSAFSSTVLKDNKITCVFFGDGATNEGTFSESLNIASLWNLPVLFLLENNGVAITTLFKNTGNKTDLNNRVKSYGIEYLSVDGQDVESVYETVINAVEIIRTRKIPVFIEGITHRFNEHAEGTHYLKMKNVGYRDNNQIELYKKEKDPIYNYFTKLKKQNLISDKEFTEIVLSEQNKIKTAVKFAEDSSFPLDSTVFKNIFI
jgi:TPP-dependent pyruvate/acetoin dehydrogenase alpha subunit